MFLFLKFEKPGSRSDFDYPDMVKESVTNAIQDTKGKVSFSDFQQAVVAYVDGIVLSCLYCILCYSHMTKKMSALLFYRRILLWSKGPVPIRNDWNTHLQCQ
jgi:hypothetical protein